MSDEKPMGQVIAKEDRSGWSAFLRHLVDRGPLSLLVASAVNSEGFREILGICEGRS